MDDLVVNTSTGEVLITVQIFIVTDLNVSGTETNTNESGGTYLYWAFAEKHVGSNNV